MQRATAEIGSTANSYQILAKLAVGGMAEIFLARSASVGGVERYVVLKRVLRERAADVEFIRMFLDEARLAAQLQHPNVAQVYDIGKLGDSFFFTMEYVHGETVRGLLHRAYALRKPLPIGNVLTIIANTAAGLHHAHERVGVDGRPLAIVHRDVSPSNLMVSYEGHVKVVDFGVAKASDRLQETKAGTVKGKISYLSPEQCRTGALDRRSDLFSLGIVMWEMLTTERLFKKATDFDNMLQIVNEDAPPPSALRPEIPPEVDAIVRRLLARQPDDRYQTAADVVDAIEEVAARSNSILSASALGRSMKELFGQRPEPWIEMTVERQPEVITVTSEPIPAMITVAPNNSMEAQLANVTDLSVVRPSGPIHFAPTVLPTSRPVMRLDASSALPLLPPLPPPEPRERSSLALVVIGVIATAVLASVVMYLVMRNRTAAVAPADAPRVALPTPSPVDAAAPAPLDAAAPAPPPIDAAAFQPTILVDAGAPPADAPGGEAKPVDELLALFAADRFAEVVERCLAAPSIADHGAACTIAACRQHRPTEAKRWFARVSAARRNLVVTTCKGQGIQVEASRPRPRPEPDCTADPLACQH